MDHPVTVGAHQREVIEPGRSAASDVQRDDVMALDEAPAAFAVSLCEVEPADLTRNWPSTPTNSNDLALTQPTITLADDVTADEKPTLGGSNLVLLVFHSADQARKVAMLSSRPQRLCLSASHQDER
jgi:phage-related baseplate assembly protein